MEFCAERRLYVGNTYLSSIICISTQRVQDGVELKNKIDLVLGKKDMLRYVQDIRAVRRIGQGLSDHSVVL